MTHRVGVTENTMQWRVICEDPDCRWDQEGPELTRSEAYEHARSSGHEVVVYGEFEWIYQPTPKKAGDS